eukprot:11225446-Lingulodinium_polyedra.AAC.1
MSTVYPLPTVLRCTVLYHIVLEKSAVLESVVVLLFRVSSAWVCPVHWCALRCIRACPLRDAFR